MTDYMAYTPAAAAVAGLLLRFLGRKLFWFFVAVAGFLVGLQFATQYFRGPTPIVLLIALAAGIIGALLAVLVRGRTLPPFNSDSWITKASTLARPKL
jgi:hypothetical protein